MRSSGNPIRAKALLVVIVKWTCAFALLFRAAALSAAEPVTFEIRGLEGEALANAQAALAVPPGAAHEGRLDRKLLDRLVLEAPEKVRRALEPFGYYDAVVTADLAEAEEGAYRVLVHVAPGEPVRVAAVRVAIEGEGSREEPLLLLARNFPLRKGDVLRQDAYEQVKGALQARAQDLGFLDADFPVHVIRVNRGEKSAEIELTLDTGPRYAFDGAAITGDSGYPERFLRRYLAFKQGEVFSFAKLGQTQLNFRNSDRFKEVIIVPKKEEARDRRVPVEVRLTPSLPKRLRPGVGYGTDTGARVSLKYQDVNAFRRGHEFKADLFIAEIRQAIGAEYIFPSSRDVMSHTSLKAGLKQEDVDTYATRSVFAEVERVRDFGRGRVGSLFLRTLYEDFSVGVEDNTSFLVLPGARFSRRSYRGAAVRPEEGYRFQLEARGTDRSLGSDTGFVQFLASGNALIALPARFSILSRLDTGYTLLNGPPQRIPASLRFFAGGDHSVRGYDYQSLGPVDNTGTVIGGRHLLAAGVEVERAVRENWAVAVFYDAGNSFNAFSRIRLFQGVGIGVRYYTVVGPIRVDLARQIRVNDPSFRLHVSVGFEF